MSSQAAFIVGGPVIGTKGSFAGAAVCHRSPARIVQYQRARWTMAKVSKFGPFTPIVIMAKLIIGDKNLNKLRGKGIALHSQAITAFCEFTGAGPKMRQNLIRTAKENGNTLGFLS